MLWAKPTTMREFGRLKSLIHQYTPYCFYSWLCHRATCDFVVSYRPVFLQYVGIRLQPAESECLARTRLLYPSWSLCDLMRLNTALFLQSIIIGADFSSSLSISSIELLAVAASRDASELPWSCAHGSRRDPSSRRANFMIISMLTTY